MDRIFHQAHVNKTLYTVLSILAHASFGTALHQLEKIFGAQNLKNSRWVSATSYEMLNISQSLARRDQIFGTNIKRDVQIS